MKEELKKIKIIEFTGTIESYNELVENLGDDSRKPYMFLDNEFNSTWKFTGIVGTFDGVIYRPGDHYRVEI